MANLLLANECNLFSYSFSGENQETLPKTQGILPKIFQILAKNSRIWMKTQGYEALLGLLGLQKCTKNKPGLVPPLAGYFYQTMPLIGWKCVIIHAWLLYRGRLLSSSGPWVERNRQRLVSTNQYSDGGRTFSCCSHRRIAVASWQPEFLPEGLWRDTSRRDHRGPIYGEDNVAGTYVKKQKIWIETFRYVKLENSTTVVPW